MDPQEIEIARRFTASPWWRWMPGMLDDGGRRVVGEDESWQTPPDATGCAGSGYNADGWSNCRLGVPDVRDAATLGCIEAIVREAWSEPTMVPLALDDGDRGIRWSIQMLPDDVARFQGIWVDEETKAGALAAALEAAPPPERP